MGDKSIKGKSPILLGAKAVVEPFVEEAKTAAVSYEDVEKFSQFLTPPIAISVFKNYVWENTHDDSNSDDDGDGDDGGDEDYRPPSGSQSSSGESS